MKHFRILLLIYLLSQPNESHAQTIYKYWYSEQVNVCMEIRGKGYNSSINEFNRMRFKLKKDDLKVIYRYYRGPLVGRIKFTFSVVKLTNDTLILARKTDCTTYFEHFGLDSIIVFKAVIRNCYENGIIIGKNIRFLLPNWRERIDWVTYRSFKSYSVKAPISF